MLSIGWVMFWKAAILAVAAVFIEKYRRWRLVQKARGLPLKDRGDGVYVVDDKLGRLEQFGRDLRDWGYMVIWCWWVVVAVLLFVF